MRDGFRGKLSGELRPKFAELDIGSSQFSTASA
jgi:hypothetical protein